MKTWRLLKILVPPGLLLLQACVNGQPANDSISAGAAEGQTGAPYEVTIEDGESGPAMRMFIFTGNEGTGVRDRDGYEVTFSLYESGLADSQQDQ
ncbi:MAG: hypothetical protein AAF530_23685 [Pseudomonadota bacterium]